MQSAPAGQVTGTFFYWFPSPLVEGRLGVHTACTLEPSAEPI